MNHANHKFTSKAAAITNGVLREQQRELVQQSMAVGVISFILALAALPVIASPGFVPVYQLVLWFAVLAAISLFQFKTYIDKARTEVPAIVSGGLLRRTETGVIVTALWWTLPWIYVFWCDYPSEHVLVLSIIQTGSAAGFCAILPSQPRIIAAFSIITTGPLTLYHLTNPVFTSTILGTLNIVLLVFLVMSTRSAYRRLRQSVMARLEAELSHNNLNDAVESLPDAFCLIDSEGNIEVRNENYDRVLGHEQIVIEHVRNMPPAKEIIMPDGRWALRTVQKTARGGYVCIHTDITGLKKREKELEDANREAQDVTAFKNRFLTQIGSDLKIPIKTLAHFSALLSERSNVKLSTTETKILAERIESNARHVQNLLTDILQVSRVGGDGQALSLSYVNLAKMLDNCCELALGQLGSVTNSDVFDITVSSKISDVYVDEVAIQRVIFNVLSKTIRQSNLDHKILIRAVLDVKGFPKITIKSNFSGAKPDTIRSINANQNGADIEYSTNDTINEELSRMQDIEIHEVRGRRVSATTIKFPKNAHRRSEPSLKKTG